MVNFTNILHVKVLRAAFLFLHLRYVVFWRKNIGAKAALKMLVKLTTEKDYNSKLINISWVTMSSEQSFHSNLLSSQKSSYD
jgi:hypothetical protein